ncbi:VanZ family protein [Psychromonas sp. PT13]|uniref:VanZ family protein n=1 Tax=Psychromonas sp. PT13 TaxID=3439547 RepID=UPI003EC123BE
MLELYKFCNKYLNSFLILAIAGLAFLSLSRSLGIPVYSAYIEVLLGSDKWLHFIAGFIVTLAVFRVLRRALSFNIFRTVLMSLTFALFILCFDELSQLMNVNRRFDLNDLICGFIGMALCTLIIILIHYFYRSKIGISIDKQE